MPQSSSLSAAATAAADENVDNKEDVATTTANGDLLSYQFSKIHIHN